MWFNGYYTVDGFYEPICDVGEDCDECVCHSCEKETCEDCEYFAMTRGISDVAIGGVFADVAKELFADDLMPGITFEDYSADNSDNE